MARSATTTTGDSAVSIAAEEATDGEQSLDESAIFEVLSNDRRRHAIEHLRDRGPEAEWPTLRELAREVAARETGVEPAAVTAEDRRRVHIALHQTHLPTLEDHGIVEYDTASKRVALTDRATALTPYVGEDNDRAGVWPAVYAGVGGAGLGLAALAAVVGLPDGGGAALVALAVVVTAIAQVVGTDVSS
mgnify:CR=1 FL=1